MPVPSQLPNGKIKFSNTSYIRIESICYITFSLYRHSPYVKIEKIYMYDYTEFHEVEKDYN